MTTPKIRRGKFRCTECGHKNEKSYDGYCTRLDCFCQCGAVSTDGTIDVTEELNKTVKPADYDQWDEVERNE